MVTHEVFLQYAKSSTMDGLSGALTNFSLDLYRQAGNVKKDSNFTVSPVSVVYCTALTYAGARGATKDNLDKVFRLKELGGGPEGVLGAFGDTLEKINVKAVQQKHNSQESGPAVHHSGLDGPSDETQLILANAVFIAEKIELNNQYKDAVVQRLKASVEKKDFGEKPEAVRGEINKWVSQHTYGKIADLLPKDSIKKDTIGVLVSAVYFKAPWLRKFHKESTSRKPFYEQNGQSNEVDTMSIQYKFAYTEDSTLDVQYVELPYRDGTACMVILLPRKKDGLKKLETALTAEAFRGLAGKVGHENKIDLDLPKFKIEGDYDLKDLLEKAGLTEIFSDSADLTGITSAGQRVKISQAFHKTFIGT